MVKTNSGHLNNSLHKNKKLSPPKKLTRLIWNERWTIIKHYSISNTNTTTHLVERFLASLTIAISSPTQAWTFVDLITIAFDRKVCCLFGCLWRNKSTGRCGSILFVRMCAVCWLIHFDYFRIFVMVAAFRYQPFRCREECKNFCLKLPCNFFRNQQQHWWYKGVAPGSSFHLLLS